MADPKEFDGPVRAKRPGFAGQFREAGDEFHFKGLLGSWMEEVSDDEDKPRRGRAPKSSTNASSVDEKPLHKAAEPESGKHNS